MEVSLFCLGILCVVFLDFRRWCCRCGVIEYEQIQYYSDLSGATPILSTTAISAVHCAVLCHGEPECKSFSFDCDLIGHKKTSGECNLHGGHVTSPSALGYSSLCYVQTKIVGVDWDITILTPPTTTPTSTPTTTKAATTTATTTTLAPTTTTATTTTTLAPTTTTTTATTTTTLAPTTTTTTATTTSTAGTTTTDSVSGSIRGLVNGDFRLCSGSSARDFVLIHDSGVYVYEDLDSLILGHCDGPTDLASMFPGYGSLPPASDIECVLMFQNLVEMYADGYVYIWQNQGGSFAKHLGTRIVYASYLGSTASTMIGSKTIRWCALRSKNNVERHFYLDDSTYVLVDSQAGTYQYTQDDTIRYNGFNLIPWSNLPGNVVAACGYTSQQNENFALIDSALQVYSYEMVHSPDNNNPTKVLTPVGTLVV